MKKGDLVDLLVPARRSHEKAERTVQLEHQVFGPLTSKERKRMLRYGLSLDDARRLLLQFWAFSVTIAAPSKPYVLPLPLP